MSKLLISLLFFFLVVYSIAILMYAYKEWNDKIEIKKENIELEKQNGLQQIEINKLKHELAKLKESLYNENKEEKRWKKQKH